MLMYWKTQYSKDVTSHQVLTPFPHHTHLCLSHAVCFQAFADLCFHPQQEYLVLGLGLGAPVAMPLACLAPCCELTLEPSH